MTDNNKRSDLVRITQGKLETSRKHSLIVDSECTPVVSDKTKAMKSSERLQYIYVNDNRETSGDFLLVVHLDGGGAAATIPSGATVQEIAYRLQALALNLETSAGERAEANAAGTR